MEKISVDAFSTTSKSLEELKRELGQLSSYTAELGIARDAAMASQQAASRVLNLVAQLEDLQKSQLNTLKIDNDTALSVHRQALFQLSETWENRLREEAAKLLMAFDTIVSRQHQLGAELAEFQNAMREASRFTEALESIKLQTIQNGEDMARMAVVADTAFPRLEATITHQTAALQEALQRESINNSVLLNQINIVLEQRDRQLKIEWAELLSKFSELLTISKYFSDRASQQNNNLESILNERSKIQAIAIEQLTISLDKKYDAYCSTQAEVIKNIKIARKESLIWNSLILVIAFGILIAMLILRSK